LPRPRVLTHNHHQSTFTGPDENSLVTGFKEPDRRAARLNMKQQVEKILDSSGEGQGAVTVTNMEEALMLSQVLQSVKRSSVEINFPVSTKHAARAELIEAFLQGCSDNIILQALHFPGASMSKAEVVPLARCLNWSHPMMIVNLHLPGCARALVALVRGLTS
jgi:hypothetical protein